MYSLHEKLSVGGFIERVEKLACFRDLLEGD
jgi:hypothetical protein